MSLFHVLQKRICTLYVCLYAPSQQNFFYMASSGNTHIIIILSGGTRAGQGSVYPTGGHQDLRRHGVQPSRSSCQQGNY